MSEQTSFFCNNEEDSGILDDFTLKVSSSECSGSDDDLRLEFSSDEDNNNNNNNSYSNSSKDDENQLSTTEVADNRPRSPVFNFTLCKKYKSLDYKLQLSYNKVEAYLAKAFFSNTVNANEEEKSSSSESEPELNRFKKISRQTNKELFSLGTGSILSVEENLTDNNSKSPAIKESDELERRIICSITLKGKKSESGNKNGEENYSSTESELELSRFKKISRQNNKELLSSDSGSILSEEESLLENRSISSVIKESGELERRITRSYTLKRKKLLRKKVLAVFKRRRIEKIKILMPFVSACVTSGAPSKKSLSQKLRQMKLFKIL